MLRTRRVQQYRGLEEANCIFMTTYFGRVGETRDKSRQLTNMDLRSRLRRMVRLRRCAAALQRLRPGLEGSRLVVVGP